ncbi:MAG TPA: hypothetical protein VHY91_22715 [Pirellulales bacterium]|nr:hypothetical protein [Pirellulales bacterium]
MEQTAVVAVAAQLAGAAALAGGSMPPGLMSYIDPLVRPVISAIPDAENALPLLQQAARLLARQRGGSFPFLVSEYPGSDLPAVEPDCRFPELRRRARLAIGLIEQAVARGRLEVPPGLSADDDTGGLSHFLFMSVAMESWGERRADRGGLVEAARISRTMAEAFRLLQSGGGAFSDYHIALECGPHAWKPAWAIASSKDAGVENLRNVLQSLPRQRSLADDLRRSVAAELNHRFLPLVEKLNGGDLETAVKALVDQKAVDHRSYPDKYPGLRYETLLRLFTGHPCPFNAIDTVKRASGQSVAFGRGLDTPWLVQRQQYAARALEPEKMNLAAINVARNGRDPSDPEIEEARQRLRSIENPIGKRLVESMGSDARKLQLRALETWVFYDVLRLKLSIRIYWLEQNKLPDDLVGLVDARILSELPLDPFSTEPFHYCSAQRAIWSIGPNGDSSPTKPRGKPLEFPYVWKLDDLLSRSTPA